MESPLRPATNAAVSLAVRRVSVAEVVGERSEMQRLNCAVRLFGLLRFRWHCNRCAGWWSTEITVFKRVRLTVYTAFFREYYRQQPQFADPVVRRDDRMPGRRMDSGRSSIDEGGGEKQGGSSAASHIPVAVQCLSITSRY